MYRRDRIGSSGSTVSSVVSSFTKKSRESAKENIPSKLPRGPTTPKELLGRSSSMTSRSRDFGNQNGSTGSRSERSSVSSRHASTASSVSSLDGEPLSPVDKAGSPVTSDNSHSGKVQSPKVCMSVYFLSILL